MAVNYPFPRTNTNESKTSEIKTKDYTKSKLGQSFEDLINAANKYYLDKQIAAIYKKPTPIQVVKVEYPKRSKAKITEAYYKIPSTTDYNGIYKEKYIDFEAKSLKGLSFPFEHLYAHQIKHLMLVKKLGGIAFLMIHFNDKNETFIIDAVKLNELYINNLNGGRKSIPYSYCKENALLVEGSDYLSFDYLKYLNI